MSFWSVIDPEQKDNIVCNPSAETTGNYAPIGATVTQSYDQARFGIRSWKLAMSGTSQGYTAFMTTAANTTHYASWYAWATTATMRVTMNSGTNWNSASVIGGHAGGWVRYGTALPPAQTSNSPYMGIISAENVGTLYVDAVQCEVGSYPTTYLDGDMPGLYYWNGLRHGSSSTRDAQERSGGKERDLYDDYGITVMPTFSGVGMPPVKLNLQSMALQPGALLQSIKVLPREITLNMNVNAQFGATWTSLHQKRQALINLMKPDRVRGAQPFTLVYKGTDRGVGASPLYAKFVYSSGLEFGNLQNGFVDKPQVRLLAVDPAWYEDNQITQNLTMQQAITTPYAAARINRQWQSLSTGFTTAGVSCIRVDANKGRVWFGGNFSTAGGVLCNGITYWDGTRFVAVGGATPGVVGGNRIFGLVVMPNSDVWALGEFTTAGAATARGLARWNDATNTFTGYNLTTNTYLFSSGDVDTNGNAYFAGNFRQWNGVTTASYVIKYTPEGNWSTVGTVPYSTTEYPPSTPNCLTIDVNNNVLIGSFNAGAAPGHLRKFNGNAWVDLGSTDNTQAIYAVYVDKDGTVYLGGNYTSLGGVTGSGLFKYTGSNFIPLTGLTGSPVIFSITGNGKGTLILKGYFKLSTPDNYITYAQWNGYIFSLPDILTPENLASNSDAAFNQDDLYLGWSSENITTSSASSIINLVPSQTVNVFPKITFVGPTTSSTTAALYWLENQSSNEKLYFNQIILGGETVTLDTMPGNKTMVSNYRGTIYGQPLSGSDFSAFHLLPTTNTIALFMTGQVTTTSGSAALLQYTPAHWGADGGG